MIQSIPVETAKRNLDSLVQQLRVGETITLTSPDGKPIAVLVSLQSVPTMQVSDWQARWDALVKRVSRSWQSDKSAVAILREMRR